MEGGEAKSSRRTRGSVFPKGIVAGKKNGPFGGGTTRGLPSDSAVVMVEASVEVRTFRRGGASLSIQCVVNNSTNERNNESTEKEEEEEDASGDIRTAAAIRLKGPFAEDHKGAVFP